MKTEKTVPAGAVLYDYNDLRSKFRLPRNTVLEMVKAGTFPKPRQLHPNGRRRVWIAAEVDAWMAALPPAPMGVGTFCGDEY